MSKLSCRKMQALDLATKVSGHKGVREENYTAIQTRSNTDAREPPPLSLSVCDVPDNCNVLTASA